MTYMAQLILLVSRHARASRTRMFRELFRITPDTRLLDLGSEDGSAIHDALQGTQYQPSNVYVADIEPNAIAVAHERYGFTPVLITEARPLPFPDRYFDIVYCSSVIEHVTVAKEEVWSMQSGTQFRERAARSQAAFARDISRVGANYFVQTPNRHFPVESHSCLPFVALLPRRLLILTLRISNTIWLKQTGPDWNLLTKSDLASLFPDACILHERFCGLTKSLMAIRVLSGVTPIVGFPPATRAELPTDALPRD